jgi:glycerol-3-phosphate cytidylyltransferase-like family protein
MITKEQRKLVEMACRCVKKAFPTLAGNVKFNLIPERKIDSVNILFTVMVNYDNKLEIEVEV